MPSSRPHREGHVTAALEASSNGVDPAGRPTKELPLRHLLDLSIYWLGITAIWVGLDATILPKRVEELVGSADLGKGLLVLTAAGVLMPILIQPTVGVISDHTASRWGRRKPFIAIGTILDVLFLVAIAVSDTFLALIVAYVLLQFSSNLAQGPFQGYVPDLVPARQVGLASGLMGLMIVLGQLGGVAIATAGLVLADPTAPLLERLFWPTVGLGLLELATAIVVLRNVDEGPAPRPRGGRSWRSIALSAWGTDILHERSFVWLVLSRLAFLAATGTIVAFALPYLQRTMGLDDASAGLWQNIALAAIVIPTAITVVPAARWSDRIGRKRLIYAASLTGAVALTGVALAPSLPVAIVCLVPVGVAAGAFLAVDWALMTDIIPKASSGRYMGISNIGTAMGRPVALVVAGPVLDAVARVDEPASPRAAYLVGVVFFVLAAVLLRPVDPRRREG
jgi:MFS family permease